MDIGKRPTRGDKVEPDLAAAWPCTRWGLPCRRHHCRRGALLPHHFTLTAVASSRQAGMNAPGPNGRAWGLCATSAVYFLWHFPYPSPAARSRRRTVGVTHHRGSVVLGLSSPRRKDGERPSTLPATGHYTRGFRLQATGFCGSRQFAANLRTRWGYVHRSYRTYRTYARAPRMRRNKPEA